MMECKRTGKRVYVLFKRYITSEKKFKRELD